MATGKAVGSAVRSPTGKAFGGGVTPAGQGPGFDTAAYDRLNASDAREFIRMSPNRSAVIAYERSNKNRSTVLSVEQEESE
jgi:hypothetical protein